MKNFLKCSYYCNVQQSMYVEFNRPLMDIVMINQITEEQSW